MSASRWSSRRSTRTVVTLPGLGAVPLSGFAYPWLLLFAVVPAALVALCVPF